MNLCRAVCFISAESFHNICPNLACCTELSNFDVENCSCVKAEVDGTCYVLNGNTAFLHLADIFHCHSKGISDFLDCITAAAGEYVTSCHNGTQTGSIFSCPTDAFCHIIIVFIQRFTEFAVPDKLCYRVCSDHTMKFADIFSLSLQCRSYKCQQTK